MAADRNALPDGLLYDVKNWLDITWDDDATDGKVSELIASGMAYLEDNGFATSYFETAEEAARYLDGKLGEAGDYTADGLPRTLLLEYCRYGRDHALDVFENNYQAMLLDMQNGRKVSVFELERAVPAQG